ncbi:hypothetical protein GWI34_18105 [Actinomadura sp. DSM 109109]|nr:hypothetical protein [Actinomadura lepetitiana]
MLDAESAARRDYLLLLSDMQFAGARRGFLLSWASFSEPYSSAFTKGPVPAGATTPADLFPQASFPDDASVDDPEERRRAYWQPAPEAPGGFQVAWLLDGFAEDIGGFTAARLRLERMTVSPAGHADIAVRWEEGPGRACTFRVLIENRTEPLDFPALYIRDIFEGRHPRWDAGAAGLPPFVDLRSLL